jgi:hypothetical protein
MMLEHCVLKDQEMELREYAAALPPLHVLIRQYRVHPGIAWMLWRPVIAALEPQVMAKVEVNTPFLECAIKQCMLCYLHLLFSFCWACCTISFAGCVVCGNCTPALRGCCGGLSLLR